MGDCRVVSALVIGVLLALIPPVVSGDTVISSTEVEILEAGSFQSSSDWSFSSTTGFTNEQAEYTVGMIADEEMSFTHSRPDNFDTQTSWASSGCSDCNATFDEADGIYSWSRGPDITMGGYSFSGLHSLEIENVSLVLHFSIPDALPSDEVNVILQNHGSDILLTTYARTLGPVNRMINPLVLNLDSHIEWDWSKLEQTQFNVDYVSDNQGMDDSEVRVDAVGLRIKFYQPWFSFENSRAEHTTIAGEVEVPVIDFNTYQGDISGLAHDTCGLTPDGPEDGIWEFQVSPPPNQELGRIHIFGEANITISTSSEETDWRYVGIQSGQKIEYPTSELNNIRVEIEDGCVSGARIDINDPHLVVSGRVSGSILGLSESSSYIRFAIGSFLVHSEEMDAGPFTISIPIGYALPLEGEDLSVGVATRFQWSSNGTAENTVVHIGSISIKGGFSIEWDRDPFCGGIGDMTLVEDEGGQIISLPAICSDDITDSQNLIVNAVSSDETLLKASGTGGLLTIEPEEEASGVANVTVTVIDEAGNTWEDSFQVEIESVQDPPQIVHLPGTIYVEIGESYEIVPDLFDPDSQSLTITTTKSWATISVNGTIVVSPVEVGEHLLGVSVSDGTSEVSRNVIVFVTAKPDLLVESVEIRVGGAKSEILRNGDVVEIIGFVRNQGRGLAENVTFYCSVDGILLGTGSIVELGPGDLRMAVCDIQLMGVSENVRFEVEIDGTDSIDETLEGNNILEISVPVDITDSSTGDDGGSGTIIIIALMVTLISLAAFQLGPKSLKKEFRRRK